MTDFESLFQNPFFMRVDLGHVTLTSHCFFLLRRFRNRQFRTQIHDALRTPLIIPLPRPIVFEQGPFEDVPVRVYDFGLARHFPVDHGPFEEVPIGVLDGALAVVMALVDVPVEGVVVIFVEAVTVHLSVQINPVENHFLARLGNFPDFGRSVLHVSAIRSFENAFVHDSPAVTVSPAFFHFANKTLGIFDFFRVNNNPEARIFGLARTANEVDIVHKSVFGLDGGSDSF